MNSPVKEEKNAKDGDLGLEGKKSKKTTAEQAEVGGGPGDHVSSGLRRRLPRGQGGSHVTIRVRLRTEKLASGFCKVKAICGLGESLVFYLFLAMLSLHCGSGGKESAGNAGDPGSIPGLGRFPWGRKWQPTPVLSPGRSHGWRSLAGYIPWGPHCWAWAFPSYGEQGLLLRWGARASLVVEHQL